LGKILNLKTVYNIDQWIDIIGYDYPYQVNCIGVIRLLERKTCEQSQNRKDRKKSLPGRILNQRIRAGYFSVVLRKNKKSVDCVVHRFVAKYFVTNPKKLPEVNHIDGNKTNNVYTNLEWTDTRGNTTHAYNIGLAKSGERSASAKLTDNQVLKIKNLRGIISGAELGRKYGVCKGTIYNIWSGLSWKRVK
jgi:hypothetical protein